MTRQERAFELRKRGYTYSDIADIVGWDSATAMRFFSDPAVKQLLDEAKALELQGVSEELTKKSELDTLDDRLAAVEHRSISRMFDGLATSDINDARRVFESVGHRRTELAKQTGVHQSEHEKNMGRAVVININTAVAARMTKNEFNQITEVDGRTLKSLDRDSIKSLTSDPILDKIESSLT